MAATELYAMTAQEKKDMYGAYVTNYVPANFSNLDLGIRGWRIFHTDGENIYLIADNYVNRNYIPKGKNNTAVGTSTDYAKGFSLAPAADYAGWSDISFPAFFSLISS